MAVIPVKDNNPWRDAVEDALVVCCILSDSHKDPRKAIKDLEEWNVEVAEFFLKDRILRAIDAGATVEEIRAIVCTKGG